MNTKVENKVGVRIAVHDPEGQVSEIRFVRPMIDYTRNGYANWLPVGEPRMETEHGGEVRQIDHRTFEIKDAETGKARRVYRVEAAIV